MIKECVTQCPLCLGKGWIRKYPEEGSGFVSTSYRVSCGVCDGSKVVKSTKNVGLMERTLLKLKWID